MRTEWKGLAGLAWTTLREVPPAVRRRLKPRPGTAFEPGLPSRPVLLLLTGAVVLFACICLGNWPARKPAADTFGLPADPPKSNLKEETRAEAASLSQREPVQPAKLDVFEAATPTLTAQEPMRPLPEAEGPVFTSAPLPELIFAMPHEEVDTMSNTNFTLQLFLLGWYLSNPTSFAIGQDPKVADTADVLGKIRRDLDDLKVQTSKLKDVSEKIDRIEKAVEGINNLPLQVQANTNKLNDAAKATQLNTDDLRTLKTGGNQLAEEVARLAEVVAKLQQEMRNESRKAFAPSNVTPAGPAVPVPGSSTIKLVNAWSTELSVIVDNTSHRLQPGEVKHVTRKAGNFTYEVLSVQPPRSRTLIAGETFTIRIGAQQ